MAVKNAVAKSWVITPSFDGYLYSAYPTGNKPSGYQTTPTLLDTDIVSGSLTGGENNKGAYLRLFGYSLGRQADMGTAAGARVYMRDPLGDNAWHEVDNYRALNQARTYSKNQVVRLIVQVGSLGGSQTAGRALDVKITVNGVDTNILTGQFTIQPGNFYFADNVSGNDGTGAVDNIALPFRYLQYWNGSAYTGIWATIGPGDTIVLRANSGTPWSDQTGGNNRWMRFTSPFTGTVPNGSAGHGYIHITAYPGPIGGHAPEDVYFEGALAATGGIHGINSAGAALGYGQYWSVSGLRVKSRDNAASSDGAPIGVQNGGLGVRLTDNETSWSDANDGAATGALSAGIDGGGLSSGIIAFNYVHDVTGGNQNHGIYMSGGSANAEIKYNWIYNAAGGAGIQFFNSTFALAFGNGNSVHHNYIDTTHKYGIRLSGDIYECDVYNNIVLNTGASTNPNVSTDAGIGIGPEISANVDINVVYNTLYYCSRATGGSTLLVDNTVTSGTVKIMHNLVLLGSGRPNAGLFYNNSSTDTNVTLNYNLYYDYAGSVVTAPAKDGGNSLTNQNPLLTDLAGGNYTLATGSPALGAADGTDPITVSTDIFGIARPGGGNNDLGACEGVGT